MMNLMTIQMKRERESLDSEPGSSVIVCINNKWLARLGQSGMAFSYNTDISLLITDLHKAYNIHSSGTS